MVKYIKQVVGKFIRTQEPRVLITNPQVLADLARRLIPSETEEHFVAFFCDAKNMVDGYAIVSKGTTTEAIIHPREIFKYALLANASGIFLAHNHPSDNKNPSAEDRATTSRLQEASVFMGIPIIDHVIITNDSYYSFKEGGQL